MELRSLCVWVAITFMVSALCVTRGILGHYNEDLQSEDSNQTDVFQNVEHNEHVQASESVQYKTAEIADAMQSSDIQTDPALLLSMVPKDFREKVAMEMSEATCDRENNGEECGTDESELKNASDDQMDTKIENNDTNVSTSEQVTTEESNTTDGTKPLKVNCEEHNVTSMDNVTVQVLNASQDLMELLNPNGSECTMVLFFTPWCSFSASLAPHFNALPRAFPSLHFLALDASQHSSLSTRFGTVAVPNILLFQGAKPMARFNHTERTLESLKSFIFNQSGIESKPDIVVTEADYEGPLPSTPQTGIDWLLVFSIVYVTAFIVYATMQNDRICWLIPGQEHEHQD
ncbi:thioredoxin domain-containing protein 15 [Gastrophryne carolinensis]